MKSIHHAREAKREDVFLATDEHFAGTNVNFRAFAALLVGGTYYTILHSRFNGGLFCGIELKTNEGQQEITRSISLILEMAFRQPGS